VFVEAVGMIPESIKGVLPFDDVTSRVASLVSLINEGFRVGLCGLVSFEK